MNTLGSELRKLLIALTELIVTTRSRKVREELLTLQAAVAGELQVLVDEIVLNAIPEYKAATAAVAQATRAAKAAKKDLEAVAEAIDKLATAVDAVGKLVALLKP